MRGADNFPAPPCSIMDIWQLPWKTIYPSDASQGQTLETNIPHIKQFFPYITCVPLSKC